MVELSEGNGLLARSYARQVLRGLERSSVPNASVFEAEARWTLARVARLDGDQSGAEREAVAALAVAEGDEATLAILRQVDSGLFEVHRPMIEKNPN